MEGCYYFSSILKSLLHFNFTSLRFLWRKLKIKVSPSCMGTNQFIYQSTSIDGAKYLTKPMDRNEERIIEGMNLDKVPLRFCCLKLSFNLVNEYHFLQWLENERDVIGRGLDTPILYYVLKFTTTTDICTLALYISKTFMRMDW
jgi:hypothetical protein